MIKLFAFLCFLIAGTVWGIAMSDRLRRKRELCECVRSMLMQISVMIRYKALTVYEIVCELHCSDLCSRLNFLKSLPESYETGKNFRKIWSDSILSDTEIPDEEREILLSFGSTLGTSDIEGQVASIDAALEKIGMIQSRRSKEYQQKGKLYRSVGMLFGIMAGIMFF